MVRQRPACHHFGVGEIRAAVGNLEPDAPIVEKQVRARLQCLEHFRMEQGGAVFVSYFVFEVETEGLPRFQLHLATLEFTDAQFRPL